jgi:hypothetical protein
VDGQLENSNPVFACGTSAFVCGHVALNLDMQHLAASNRAGELSTSHAVAPWSLTMRPRCSTILGSTSAFSERASDFVQSEACPHSSAPIKPAINRSIIRRHYPPPICLFLLHPFVRSKAFPRSGNFGQPSKHIELTPGLGFQRSELGHWRYLARGKGGGHWGRGEVGTHVPQVPKMQTGLERRSSDRPARGDSAPLFASVVFGMLILTDTREV